MKVFALMLRHAQMTNRNVYSPYGFTGQWSDEDKAVVEQALKSHVPESVDSGFNNWILSNWGTGGFYARRATWDRGGLFGDTAQELAEKITDFYASYCK